MQTPKPCRDIFHEHVKGRSVNVVLYLSRVSVLPSAALWASCVEGGMEDVTDGGKG